MNRDNNALTFELHGLLELGRIIRLVPKIVRARVLARARATVEAEADLASSSSRARFGRISGSTPITGVRDRW